MKFTGENPDKVYCKITYHGTHILVNVQDVLGDTIRQVMQLVDDNQLNTSRGMKCRRVYYLRGARNQAPYGQVLVGFLTAEILPPELFEIIHCLSFWNQEAQKMFVINADEGETHQQFVLRCIAADCRAFVQPYAELFTMERDDKKVWVSHLKTGEQILLIQFMEDKE